MHAQQIAQIINRLTAIAGMLSEKKPGKKDYFPSPTTAGQNRVGKILERDALSALKTITPHAF